MQRAEVRNLSKNLFSSRSRLADWLDQAVKQVAMSKLETAMKEGAITDTSTFPLIHQGLFYQFWDSDKLQRQSDDAKRIAKLMENFKEVDMLGPWIDEQFRSLRRHWDKIDYLRIDKFLMLIRYLIRQFFTIFHAAPWKLDHKQRLLNFLISGLFGVPNQTQSKNDQDESLNLMGEKIIHSSALGVPLQFFGIWDQEFLKVYSLNDQDNEEDKDQTMLDVKLFFGKTVEIYAHTEIPELRDRILQRIEVLMENPKLPLTKTALVKIFFDNAKNPSTVEASRSKLYELMRKVQWSDNIDAKRNEELSQLMEKTHSMSQDSDSLKETSSNKSEKSEVKEEIQNKGNEEVEEEDFELSDMIPRLLEKKNKKLCKRVRKFMDKRREMSAKMKKRAEQMALLGLPLSMWIAEKQRKELLKQANVEWEILKSEIQHQLAKYQIDSVPPKRKKKKRVTIVQPVEEDDEIQAQLDTMLMEDEAPIKQSDNELDISTPDIPEVPSLEPITPETMTPSTAQKQKFSTISPAKVKEDVLQIAPPVKKHKPKPKKRSLRSNDPNVLTRSQRKVRFSPQPLLRTFHQNEIVSLKKMLSSKFSQSPSNGIIKSKSKKSP